MRPTEAKITLALEFLLKISAKEFISAKLLEQRLGLIRFMAEVLPLITPFLQPLHSWVSGLVNSPMARPSGRPGHLHIAVANFVITILQQLHSGELIGHRMFFPVQAAGMGASDAKADKSLAVIGGWWCSSMPPAKYDSYWFSFRVTKELFPWAFAKGSPQRVISALELLGTVILVRLIAELDIGGATDVTVKGITDSECNTYAFLRSYSSRLPAALIHMELMASCHVARIFPRISHRKRDENVWADELTEEHFAGWCPHRRWEPKFQAGFFHVLDNLLGLARDGV